MCLTHQIFEFEGQSIVVRCARTLDWQENILVMTVFVYIQCSQRYTYSVLNFTPTVFSTVHLQCSYTYCVLNTVCTHTVFLYKLSSQHMQCSCTYCVLNTVHITPYSVINCTHAAYLYKPSSQYSAYTYSVLNRSRSQTNPETYIF